MRTLHLNIEQEHYNVLRTLLSFQAHRLYYTF